MNTNEKNTDATVKYGQFNSAGVIDTTIDSDEIIPRSVAVCLRHAGLAEFFAFESYSADTDLASRALSHAEEARAAFRQAIENEYDTFMYANILDAAVECAEKAARDAMLNLTDGFTDGVNRGFNHEK